MEYFVKYLVSYMIIDIYYMRLFYKEKNIKK